VRKLQNILNQIEAMKSDDIKEDVKLIHEKYDTIFVLVGAKKLFYKNLSICLIKNLITT